jgi:hypothetical protein
MMYLVVTRKALAHANACAAGMQLFFTLRAEQNEERQRKGRRPRSAVWVRWDLSAQVLWARGYPAWTAWLVSNGMAPAFTGARAYLPGVNLAGASLARASFRSATLTGANLAGACLLDASMVGADLTCASLADAKMLGADLSSANLTGANMREADLADACLSGAKLGDANLSDACLVSANLSFSDLTGADLTGANLRRANLAHANLAGANLTGAHLAGVDLTGANLEGALGLSSPIPGRAESRREKFFVDVTHPSGSATVREVEARDLIAASAKVARELAAEGEGATVAGVATEGFHRATEEAARLRRTAGGDP